MEKNNNYKLINIVLQNSKSKEWIKAVDEWKLFWEDKDKSANTECICGHPNIVYLFGIKNKINNAILKPIGSECIKKFSNKEMKFDFDIYKSLIKLHNEIKYNNSSNIELNGKWFSKKLLKYLYEQNCFKPTKYNQFKPEKDFNFMLDMFNKKDKDSITIKQKNKIYCIIKNDIKNFIYSMLEKFREIKNN